MHGQCIEKKNEICNSIGSKGGGCGSKLCDDEGDDGRSRGVMVGVGENVLYRTLA